MSVGALLQVLGSWESVLLWHPGSVGWFPVGVNITGGIVFPIMLLGLSSPWQHRTCVPQRRPWNKIAAVFSKLPALEQVPVRLAPSQRRRICLDNISQPDHQKCCSFCRGLSPQEGSSAFFPVFLHCVSCFPTPQKQGCSLCFCVDGDPISPLALQGRCLGET